MQQKTTKTAIAVLFLFAGVSAQDWRTISTYAELSSIGVSSGYPLSGYYRLAGDIVVPSSSDRGGGFTPIGSAGKPFTGIFDGNGKAVRGLYINRERLGNVGLFGVIGAGGVVRNLGVAADTVVGSHSVGALAGVNNGTVSGCYSAGVVIARRQDASNAGGLVGINGGVIERSYSAANVAGRERIGGLAGLLASTVRGDIIESFASGEVRGHSMVGGLVGYVFGGMIDRCFSTGLVIGSSVAGGLVGGDYGSGSAEWNVRGQSGSGAYVSAAVITNSFWDMSASNQTGSVGGAGMTTAQMLDSTTFAGWDFDTAWDISNGSYYPRLAELPSYAMSYAAGPNGSLRVGGTSVLTDVYVMSAGEGVRTLNIEAVPADGYKFVMWSDGLEDPIRSDIAEGDAEFTAQFVMSAGIVTHKLAYTVSDTAWGGLRVAGAGVTIESFGYSVTAAAGSADFHVTAVVKSGSRFLGWSDGVSDSVRIDAAVADMSVTALFAGPGVSHAFAYMASDAGGMITAEGAGGAGAFYVVPNVPRGSLGPIAAAVPADGYSFVKWNDGAASMVRTDTAKSDLSVLALFEKINYISINTYNDLSNIGKLASLPLDGNYELTGDIDASASGVGDGFAPIGTKDAPFSGVFKGGGYRITGLRVSAAGAEGAGLFGYANGAFISGVILEDADVTGGVGAGALAGVAVNTVIDSCGSSGAVTGSASIGGLVGRAVNSLISRGFSLADVSATDSLGAGGLAGVSSTSLVTRSYAAGSADGAGASGGFAGLVDGGTVQYSYSAADARGSGAVGGFAGVITRRGKVFQCYSMGRVEAQGAASAGGLAGAVTDGGAAIDCYWDIIGSGQSASAGGVGKTPAEMILASTYKDWDFVNVWYGDRDRPAGSYPYLRAFGAPQTIPGLGKFAGGVVKTPSARPAIRVRGRSLTVTAPAEQVMRVRMIDMRGRTVALHNAVKSGQTVSLIKIPAGKYMVEIRERGKRSTVTSMVVK